MHTSNRDTGIRLVNSHGLGQVPRSVRVDAAKQRKLIGNELQWKHRPKRCQGAVLRDDNGVIIKPLG